MLVAAWLSFAGNPWIRLIYWTVPQSTRCTEEVKTPGEEVSKAKTRYNVEFTFDTDARVAITIYYQATEEFQNGTVR